MRKSPRNSSGEYLPRQPNPSYPNMKPVVSTGKAYFCTILSAFAVVILSIIGYLFKIGHESMMGSTSDPEDGDAVAHTVFGAVFVYLAFLLFCGSQVFLIQRESRIKL